jgi:hypothetical protein
MEPIRNAPRAALVWALLLMAGCGNGDDAASKSPGIDGGADGGTVATGAAGRSTQPTLEASTDPASETDEDYDAGCVATDGTVACTQPAADAWTAPSIGNDDSGCVATSETPACKQPAPHYSADIAPLLDRDCNSSACHAQGGPTWPLTDYSDVAAWATLILADVEGCTMPPPDAGTLSSDDEALLINWLACGVPQ